MSWNKLNCRHFEIACYNDLIEDFMYNSDSQNLQLRMFVSLLGYSQSHHSLSMEYILCDTKIALKGECSYAVYTFYMEQIFF